MTIRRPIHRPDRLGTRTSMPLAAAIQLPILQYKCAAQRHPLTKIRRSINGLMRTRKSTRRSIAKSWSQPQLPTRLRFPSHCVPFLVDQSQANRFRSLQRTTRTRCRMIMDIHREAPRLCISVTPSSVDRDWAKAKSPPPKKHSI